MIFKRPENSYDYEAKKFEAFLKEHQQNRLLVRQARIDAQDKDEAERYLRQVFYNFRRIFALVEYWRNDYIPLDNMFMTWTELAKYRYGNFVGGWLIKEIKNLIAEIDDPCVSNITYYEIGNEKEQQDYDASTDCCGRTSKVKTHWLTRRKFRFGFNYGH